MSKAITLSYMIISGSEWCSISGAGFPDILSTIANLNKSWKSLPYLFIFPCENREWDKDTNLQWNCNCFALALECPCVNLEQQLYIDLLEWN